MERDRVLREVGREGRGGLGKPRVVTTVLRESEEERRERGAREEKEGDREQRRTEQWEDGIGFQVDGGGFQYVHTDCPCGLPPLPDADQYWGRYWKEVKQVLLLAVVFAFWVVWLYCLVILPCA